jgi:hypothetical protein
MASVRLGWSSRLLAQAATSGDPYAAASLGQRNLNAYRGCVAIVQVDNTDLACGRGARHLKHWSPHFRLLELRPDIGAAVAADPTSKFRLEIEKSDVIGSNSELIMTNVRTCSRRN